jgi:glutaredoxin
MFFKLLVWRQRATPYVQHLHDADNKGHALLDGEGIMARNTFNFRRVHLAAMAASMALFCLGTGPAAAACSKKVVLYNADWCPYCRQVRIILARNGIKYSMLDATTERVQADMIRRFGDTAIPRTMIGASVVEGVDEARIKQLCR